MPGQEGGLRRTQAAPRALRSRLLLARSPTRRSRRPRIAESRRISDTQPRWRTVCLIAARRGPRAAPSRARRSPRGADATAGVGGAGGAGAPPRARVGASDLDRERAPHSAILYGPPGSGKTTLARIAAAGAEGAFEEESAVNAGRAEIRAVIERASERRQVAERHTVLFLDEIHRFNKVQQDALLPAVEEGLLTLIGATTENPYFEVNSALLSRCQVYELRPLEPEQVKALIGRALGDPERGITDPPGRGRGAGDARAQSAGRTRRPLGLGAGGAAIRFGPVDWLRLRMHCSARRSITTVTGTATTTSSPPGSRRRAALMSTPPSTTWR